MKRWMRKVSVVLIAIMTLGLYVPPTYLNTNAEENNEAVSPDADVNQDVLTSVSDEDEIDLSPTNNDDNFERDYVDIITEKAKEQTITKLGPRIVGQVEDDFEAEILPHMESVLEIIMDKAGVDNAPYLAITEHPSQGSGEKIFNIYDERTKKDVAKFHVRRDNRPLEGYWFNFHYHLSNDNFEMHHEIGEIYWDKNTPPKWMA
ncbi:YpjP family protein [Virgibacillus sp. FSP13]